LVRCQNPRFGSCVNSTFLMIYLRRPVQFRPALAVVMQVDTVGGVRTDHRFETTRNLPGHLRALDDQADLCIDPPGPLIIVHGSDVEALPVHDIELGVQTVCPIT